MTRSPSRQGYLHRLKVVVVVMLVAAFIPELRIPPQVPWVIVPAVIEQSTCVLPVVTIWLPDAFIVSVRVAGCPAAAA